MRECCSLRITFVVIRYLSGIALHIAWSILSANAQVLPFVSYTPQDNDHPLPSAEVQSTFQDPQGYIWMAIYSSGLARYNGHSYDLFTTEDGLRHPGVLDILDDKMGRLWVSSDLGLSVSSRPLPDYEAGSRIQFTTQIGGTPLIDVSVRQNALVLDHLGRIWVGTNNLGIIRYTYISPDEILVDTLNTAISGNPGKDAETVAVRSLTVGKEGTVWAGLSGGAVMMFENGNDQFRVISTKTETAEQSINVLHESASGILWGGTNEGALVRLDEEGGQFVMKVIIPEMGGTIFGMTSTASGKLWIASEGAGLIAVDPLAGINFSLYTRVNGLLSENVHHVMLDREANLWVSQSGGVSKLRFDHEAFRYITARSYAGEKPQLPSATVPSLFVPAHSDICSLWVGTQDGGVACVRANGESIYIKEENGLRSNRVNALTMDKKGTVWIGTFSGINGIAFSADTKLPGSAETTSFMFDGKAGRITGYRGTSIYSITKRPFAVDEARSRHVESIWFPGFKSIYLLVEDRWYIFRASSGLPSTSYNVVEIDSNGYLWVGTSDQGIYRSLAPLSLESLGFMETIKSPYTLAGKAGTFGLEVVSPLFEPLLPADKSTSVSNIQALRFNKGEMWVGTPEGIFISDENGQGNLLHLTTKDGLRSNNVNSMDFSPVSGLLWVGTNKGLVEIDPYTKKVIRQITKQDGLIDEESWFYGSIATDTLGRVYYGSANGVTIYDPGHDAVNKVPPGLQIYNAVYTENNRGANEFFVEYAGLSFANEKRVQYKTRLLGYESEWSAPTQDVKIRYTNLPAYFSKKNYTFEVLASNADGEWTATPQLYAFNVKPALWLRGWAMLIYAMIVAGLLFFTDRVQRAKLIKSERARAEIEKARELESINSELQLAMNHLTETRDQLIHAEKMASMGKLTSGIAHEIKNPLNFVNNFANINLELTEDILSMISAGSGKKVTDVTAELKDILADLQLNSELILKYGERANHIVESMMMHARTRSKNKIPTDFNTLVEEYLGIAYHGMQVQAEDFETMIEQYYDPDVGEVSIISQDLSHVLLNLCKNAFQAMYDKKQEDPLYRPLLKISTEKKPDSVVLSISDNGSGISEEHLDKIFEPFYTTRPSGQGIGLGLSISYDIIVHGHGGSLVAESKAGEGTTLVVRLPA